MDSGQAERLIKVLTQIKDRLTPPPPVGNGPEYVKGYEAGYRQGVKDASE